MPSVPVIYKYTLAGYHTMVNNVTLDSLMATALYIGLLDPLDNATASIPFQCQNGNCTFPADKGTSYASLAMCGSCTDITNTVSRNSSGRPLSELKFYTGDDGTTTGLRNNDVKFLSVNVPRPNMNSQNVFEWDTLMTIPQSCANFSPKSSLA